MRSAEPVDFAKLAKPNLSEKVWETQTNSRLHAKLFREDGALHYDDSYIAWLDAQGKRKRRKRFSAQASGTKTLPQLLRTLGRHLDRVEPRVPSACRGARKKCTSIINWRTAAAFKKFSALPSFAN